MPRLRSKATLGRILLPGRGAVTRNDLPPIEGEEWRDDTPVSTQLLSPGEVLSILNGPDATSRAAVDAHIAARTTAGDALPLLESLMDHAAQDMQIRLRNFLFENVNCTFESIRYTRMGQFISGIDMPSLCIVAAAREWSSPVIVGIPAQLVYTAVDSLLGGRRIGESSIEGRSFSTIEQRLMRQFAANVLEGVSTGFAAIARPSFKVERVETVPRFAMTSAPAKQVVVVRFRIEANERSGFADLCIPVSAFGRFHDVLTRTSIVGDDGDVSAQMLIMDQVLSTELELVGILEEWDSDLDRIAQWQPGTRAELHPTARRRIVVAAGGRPLFVASLLGTGRKVRLRIEEICKPDVPPFPKVFAEAIDNDGNTYMVPLRRFDSQIIR